VVISDKSPVATLAEIRKMVGSYVAASTLRDQLQNSPADFARLLTADFDAILISEKSDECQIFADQGFKNRLEDRTGGLN